MERRMTIQKTIILNSLKELHHPSAEELFEVIHQEYPLISKATVYRNLNLLVEEWIIDKLEVTDGPARFDLPMKKHYHLRCDNCGKLMDIEMDYLDDLDSMVKNNEGFQIKSHTLTFHGLCPECNNKKENGGF